MLTLKDLVFLDTETHSLEQPIVIQVAHKRPGETPVMEYFSTGGTKIDLKAMAVHHITEEALQGLPVFTGSSAAKNLENELASGILVAHNATFDAGVLRSHGVPVPHTICTLRVARHVHPDIEQHKLQYLRYWYGVRPAVDIRAHDAEGDILVLEAVFERLFQDLSALMGNPSESEVLQAMVEISSHPSVLQNCVFGKHKGERWSEIPLDYLRWILEKSDFDDENVLYTAKFYLERAFAPYTPKPGAQSYVCGYTMPQNLPKGFVSVPAVSAPRPAPAVFRRS